MRKNKELVLKRARSVTSKRLAEKVVLAFLRELCDADKRGRLITHLQQARILAPCIVKN